MENIQRLSDKGTLVLAGPFQVDEPAPDRALAGFFLLDVATREEAVAVMESDPAVTGGRFLYEVHGWWGPAEISYAGAKPKRAEK